jgi:hypothetical protein
MPRRSTLLALAATLLAAPARLAFAQEEQVDINAAAAYEAIANTPLGALPPMLGAQIGAHLGTRSGDMSPRRVGVYTAAGYLDEPGPFSRRSVGVGVDVPVSRTTLTLTGGMVDFTCDEAALAGDPSPGESADVKCDRAYMGGARWFAPLVSFRFGGPGTSAFNIGLDATAGYASFSRVKATFTFPDSATSAFEQKGIALSGSVGMPVAISARTGWMMLTPYVAPRFAFGHLQDEVVTRAPDGSQSDDKLTESGSRFMLGGGLGIRHNGSGIGLDLGFQRIFLPGANTLVGVGLTFGR